MYTIYGVPLSVHTRKVIVVAIEKKLDFKVEPVIPYDPPPGWSELSPTGKIPALSDGYMSLADSSVICMHLEHMHPKPAIYPAEHADHMRALWFEEYCDGTLFPGVVHALFFQNVIRPNMLNERTDQSVVATVLGESLPRAFGYLESSLSGAFLAGGRVSIADIALTCNLLNYHYLGYTIDLARYPRLAGHFACMVRQPSFAQAIEAEAPVVAQFGLARDFLGKLAA